MTDKLWSYSEAFFPLPSLSANPTPVLELADPVLWNIAQFFSVTLNSNMLPRFSDECAACGLTSANLSTYVDGTAVGQITGFPLNPSILTTTLLRFPILNLYCEKEEFVELAKGKFAVKRDFVVSWILPPLTPQQYNSLYVFFGVIAKICSAYFTQGFDPKVSTVSFWTKAGLAFGSMEGISYKPFLGLDNQAKDAFFPAMQIRFSFIEHNEEVSLNFVELEDFYIEQDLVDGYNINDPVLNFIDGYAYPNLVLSSCSPSSGPLAGGSWLVLQGQGFSSTVLKHPSQITICGAQAASFVILSPSVLRVITSPGIATGTGNVVIYNTDGSFATQLLTGYTYV